MRLKNRQINIFLNRDLKRQKQYSSWRKEIWEITFRRKLKETLARAKPLKSCLVFYAEINGRPQNSGKSIAQILAQ